MREFDFSPLFRSAIGFDRLPTLIDTAMRAGASADVYPPYNIEKLGDDQYRITVAVAGFERDALEIEIRDGTLVVTGKDAREPSAVAYLHRGIAGRAFARRFQLAEHVEVSSAALANGLLTVDLVRELPEAMKPRRIEIAAPGKVVEHKTAA